jgi:hypothetical protein
MSSYKIYNGSEWVDLCDCDIKILDHNNVWVTVNTSDCVIRYWTGNDWCEIQCPEQEQP